MAQLWNVPATSWVAPCVLETETGSTLSAYPPLSHDLPRQFTAPFSMTQSCMYPTATDVAAETLEIATGSNLYVKGGVFRPRTPYEEKPHPRTLPPSTSAHALDTVAEIAVAPERLETNVGSGLPPG
jgi:hypothetical protein